tara:strand:- start:147 stop:392 length:246 start_codon:yes stop_codon:yes gene_type:complete
MIDTDEYERRLREVQPFNHLAWELIQEIKRLRDELDKQMGYIEWLEEFAPKMGMYNSAWEAYEVLGKGMGYAPFNVRGEEE